MNIYAHIFPFTHSSVRYFIIKEARARGVSYQIDAILEHLTKGDPLREFIVWVVQVKGCLNVTHLDDIPLREVKAKMASIGYPTTQQELEARIPRFVPGVLSEEAKESINKFLNSRELPIMKQLKELQLKNTLK